MENASKALIMAASVLIGILILSLAVFLFSDFAATSDRIHKEVKQTQDDQFNAQFTSFAVKEDNNIYDIITAVNLAKSNNTKYELTTSDEGNYYITINMNKGTNISNLEKLSESRINMLLQDELNALNGGALPSYSCQVRISEITGLVKEVKFTRK